MPRSIQPIKFESRRHRKPIGNKKIESTTKNIPRKVHGQRTLPVNSTKYLKN
jgi:hypothetical protein